jgi:hypothetical protein
LPNGLGGRDQSRVAFDADKRFSATVAGQRQAAVRASGEIERGRCQLLNTALIGAIIYNLRLFRRDDRYTAFEGIVNRDLHDRMRCFDF